MWGVRYSIPTYTRGVGPDVSWYWTTFRGAEAEARAHAESLQSKRTEDGRRYEAVRFPWPSA